MELTGRKVLVIGLGKTGRETARFLSRRGAKVLLTDRKPPADWQDVLENLPGARACPYGPEALGDAELVIPSPGVYPAEPILAQAASRGIPIVSELELAWRFLRTPLLAVTGTNGKTTVTTLIGEILKKAGKKVFVGGNIGAPLIGYVDGPQPAEWVVVEVSSFQLQWAETFRPRVGILLNVTPDHLDYHGSLQAYRLIKESLFARQEASDVAILNADEEATAGLAARIASRKELFSSTKALRQGIFREGEQLVWAKAEGEREFYPVSMIRLPGRHNVENVMAAIVAARHCRCSPETIVSTVEGFGGIDHRIQFAGERDGVRFYDDSKGTNVGAVMRALESFPAPVILLLGGRDKEGDFQSLAPLLREKVRRLILFGEARRRIEELVGNVVATDSRPTLAEAVEAAWHVARPGEVVLLSPGCASFDEFRDYKARGEFFQGLVGRLER